MTTENPCLFFFFFLFYHAFIVLWYKKLRAALAMERTKPINQNKQHRKPIHSPTAGTEKPLSSFSLKPFGYRSIRKQNKGKTSNTNYFSLACFLQGNITYVEKSKPTRNLYPSRKTQRKNLTGGTR